MPANASNTPAHIQLMQSACGGGANPTADAGPASAGAQAALHARSFTSGGLHASRPGIHASPIAISPWGGMAAYVMAMHSTTSPSAAINGDSPLSYSSAAQRLLAGRFSHDITGRSAGRLVQGGSLGVAAEEMGQLRSMQNAQNVQYMQYGQMSSPRVHGGGGSLLASPMASRPASACECCDMHGVLPNNAMHPYCKMCIKHACLLAAHVGSYRLTHCVML